MKNTEDIFQELEKNAGKGKSIGIVRALWNSEITTRLYNGCIKTLLDYGVTKEHILTLEVPGSFELIYGCKKIVHCSLDRCKLDAIILIGSIIKGETPHFDFISSAIIHGTKDFNLMKNQPPVVLCVSTDLNKQQGMARSGGEYGNKGIESALTALHLIKNTGNLSLN